MDTCESSVDIGMQCEAFSELQCRVQVYLELMVEAFADGGCCGPAHVDCVAYVVDALQKYSPVVTTMPLVYEMLMALRR